MQNSNRKTISGFTLVELLSVIVILAILLLLVSTTVLRIFSDSKTTITEVQEKSIVDAAEKWSVYHSDILNKVTVTAKACVSVETLYKDGLLSKKDIELANKQAASEYVMISYNQEFDQHEYKLAKTDSEKQTCAAFIAGS